MKLDFDVEFISPRDQQPAKLPSGANLTLGLLIVMACDHASSRPETTPEQRAKVAKLAFDALSGGEREIDIETAAQILSLVRSCPVAVYVWVLAEVERIIEGARQ